MGKLNYFVASTDKQTSFDEAKISLLSFRVIETFENGKQAVQLEGEYADVVDALINSDVIIVAVSSDDDPIAEA